jgi:hypothetical protein
MRRGVIAVAGLSMVAFVIGWWWRLPSQDSFDEIHSRLRGANPTGIRYELRIADGRSRFRIGEAIPIELRFSSSLSHTYGFDYSTYDRSGRMLTDRFVVDPSDGQADPLADYFGTGILGGLTGGLRGRPVLGSEPISITAHLNEWVRFDRPGRYKVFARSQRIRREVFGASGAHVEDVEIASGMIELTIIEPEPGWMQAEVDRMSRLVGNPDEQIRRKAQEGLRFLGTVPALNVMADGLAIGQAGSDLYTFGIIGSRYGSEARQILEERLVDPTRSIDEWFLRVLAYLRIRPWLAISFPMPYEYPMVTSTARWGYQYLGALYQRAFEFAVDKAARDLARATPSKTPEARSACLATIESIYPELARTISPTARRPAPPPTTLTPDDTMGRLQRTDRTAFRERVLADLRQDSPKLRFYLRYLTDLPDRELPDLEGHFAARAPYDPWLFGHLLARYGTRRVLPSVRATYVGSHLRWGCDSRLPFLAYFLRVAPSEGAAFLRKALQEREGNGCYHNMLTGVARVYSAQELEPIAIHSLDDPDPEVAADAALTLASYGTASAEPYLWRRLERWTQRWRGRQRELYGNLATGEGRQFWQVKLGEALEGAIQFAQSWYFDETRRQRLAGLCVTDACRGRFMNQPKAPPTVRVQVFQMMYAKPTYAVGAYTPGTLDRFRQKVAQFPRGTVFGWCTEREGGSELSKEEVALSFRNVQGAVESQGFRFDPNPPDGSCFTDKNWVWGQQ